MDILVYICLLFLGVCSLSIVLAVINAVIGRFISTHIDSDVFGMICIISWCIAFIALVSRFIIFIVKGD